MDTMFILSLKFMRFLDVLHELVEINVGFAFLVYFLNISFVAYRTNKSVKVRICVRVDSERELDLLIINHRECLGDILELISSLSTCR